jgi:hypothetical protein
MSTLHTFGCSITQGFALPDVVKPILNTEGVPHTPAEVQHMLDNHTVHWSDIHLYQPSQWAWPQQLADRLGWPVVNHARRGACFQQIARQCAMAQHSIQPTDVVIVMWTYLSRLSLQWPARTSVPLCNIVDNQWGFVTRILPGFNQFFGLTPVKNRTAQLDQHIHDHIQDSVNHSHVNPMGLYNRYHNSMILLCMTDGMLRATGARVIHLSVETQPYAQQLEQAREALPESLKPYTEIPNPSCWYHVRVDHLICQVIHDPSIPPAENDMHPSTQHHANFAQRVHTRYFAANPPA